MFNLINQVFFITLTIKEEEKKKRIRSLKPRNNVNSQKSINGNKTKKVCSVITRLRISNARKGQKHSDSTKEKIRNVIFLKINFFL